MGNRENVNVLCNVNGRESNVNKLKGLCMNNLKEKNVCVYKWEIVLKKYKYKLKGKKIKRVLVLGYEQISKKNYVKLI